MFITGPLTSDGRQRRDAVHPEEYMAEAAGSPQRQHHRAGSLLGHPNLHLGGPVNDIADLCQLLLLLLPPQDKDEGIEHLRECSPHEGETGRGEKGPQKNNKRLFSVDYSTDIRDFSVSFERH